MALETQQLIKIYRKRKVVDGISINVNRGEVVGLLGPNGAGKTTTFYMVVGLIKPNKGKVLFDGKDISKLPMHKRARLGIGYLAQEPSVFRNLTVEQNILTIWQLRGVPKSLKKKQKCFKISLKVINNLKKYLDIKYLIPLLNKQFFFLNIPKELQDKNQQDTLNNALRYLFSLIKELNEKQSIIYSYNFDILKILNLLNSQDVYIKTLLTSKINTYNLISFIQKNREHIFNFIQFIIQNRDILKDKYKDNTDILDILYSIENLTIINKENKNYELENDVNQNIFINILTNTECIINQEQSLLLKSGLIINKEDIKEINDNVVLFNDGKKLKLSELSLNKTITNIKLCDLIEFIDKNKFAINELLNIIRLAIIISNNPTFYSKVELEEKLSCLNLTPKQKKLIFKLSKYPIKNRLNDKLEEILNEFQISKIRKNKGYQLSGGERRRVEIARAISTEPAFLLLDEPFSGIDPIAVNNIKEMIKLLKKRNIGILITDHNVRDTLTITDRAYIVSDGKIIDKGEPEYIAQSQLAQRYYLGEDFRL